VGYREDQRDGDDEDGAAMTTSVTYCTILSMNYLPKALALAESLRRHEDGATLTILFTDIARDEDLPQLHGVVSRSTAMLGLTEREVLDLATGYDLVELATAVKPLLLKTLLEDAEQVYYLDPDTYLTSPMVELSDALAASVGGILLTPHFLLPTPPERGKNEGHLLTVGVFNLGFCGVDRRARDFLDWWWGHLKDECLYDPMAGLFVDQKWMDIGSTLWQAASLRHSGYNVGVTNLPERPLALDDDGFYNAANGERLRLFHFHAFDASTPEVLSKRSSTKATPRWATKRRYGLCARSTPSWSSRTSRPCRRRRPTPMPLTLAGIGCHGKYVAPTARRLSHTHCPRRSCLPRRSSSTRGGNRPGVPWHEASLSTWPREPG
jgi:hypothetical protein